MIRSIVILGIAMAAYTQANYISVSNGHGFGKWGDEKTCPGVHPALGFRIKVEPNQGSGDDTALNAIELLCADGTRVTSSVGAWGDWGALKKCANGRLAGFRLRVERLAFEIGDDTAANDIDFTCTDKEILRGDSSVSWGDWGSWSSNCRNGIRGIQTRVESPQGSGDDTALNDVRFMCF